MLTQSSTTSSPWLQLKSELHRSIGALAETFESTGVVYLEGGHFDPRYGSTPFSISSLEAMLDLLEELVSSHGRKLRFVLGVLVDDLGLECGPEACTVSLDGSAPLETPTSAALPDELEALMAAHPMVKRERCFVQTERNARNRGLANIKKVLEGKSPHEGADLEAIVADERGGKRRYLLQADDGARVLIASREEDRWLARCPLVMAQHYSDVVGFLDKRFFQTPYPKIIVDVSEMADYDKVRRGTELGLRLLVEERPQAPVYIINTYFGQPDGSTGRIELANHADYDDAY